MIACAGTPVQERSWNRVTSENFVVVSSLRPDRSLQIAEDLEVFRLVVQKITNTKSLVSPIPTRIFVFDSLPAYKRFGSNRHAVGHFISGERANHVALVESRDMETAAVLKHEYVHFLLDNRSRIQYPRWYNEGFAEFLGAMRVEEESVIVGNPPLHRAPNLVEERWLEIAEIVDPKDYEDWSNSKKAMFYAESWALVHYLHFGRGDAADVSADMTTYLNRVAQGQSKTEAFRIAFGIEPEALRRTLQKYLQGDGRQLEIPRKKLPAVAKPTLRPIPPAELSESLGRLALAGGELPLAEELFQAARTADPGYARAQAGEGSIKVHAGEWDEAGRLLRYALELDPSDPLNHLDYGIYLQSYARSAADGAERAHLFKEARTAYVGGLRLRETPEGLALYGSTFVEAGQDPAKGLDTLEAAYDLLPSSARIRLTLARALMETGKAERAAELARSVLHFSHSDTTTEAVEALLVEIEGSPGSDTD